MLNETRSIYGSVMNKEIKVCFAANSGWYLRNFRTSTLKAFSNHFDVTGLYPNTGESLNIDEVSNQRFYCDAASTNLLKEGLSFASFFWRVHKSKCDVVFSFNPKINLYALMACFFLRKHCVPNVSGVGVASELTGINGLLYRSLAKFFYRRASFVFFQNADDYNGFLTSGWIKPECSEVLPGSGVDLNRFHPSRDSDHKLCFLMASRLIRQKGVEEFISAAREVLKSNDEACFVLAGVADHSSRAVEKSTLDGLEDEPNIHFAGHVEDMPSLLEKVDCVVLPSYYPEGIPRSLIEAAASGKIIITTDTPGCREIVEDLENGFLVSPKSVDQLVDAMKSVLCLSKEQRSSMQRASRALAEERFDENTVIDRYLKVAYALCGS
ncbi:glycosyltransferase family 4 protein [Halomonas nitroreducens]|uniref:Glycosyltransferase family 1 protein n=1 Tax=Halomonas nitroreducens TaxID=447425 RepID=A0A3S0HLZ1_9GAMM|nr:glycosyltransferase family 4 protein [Halomonas nitroreducens]RTQ97313.1 glycosyltransferase family 1 protein [Halomonas nitroreducens]